MDEETRLVTGTTVTSGEKHYGKELISLIKNTENIGLEVEAVIGDGAYAEDNNLTFCKDNVIKNVSKTVLYGNRSKENEFEFNKDAGMFVCKAGHTSIKKSHQKGNKHNNFTEVDNYYFDVEKCKHCSFREGCYNEFIDRYVCDKKSLFIADCEYESFNNFEHVVCKGQYFQRY